MRAHFHAYFTCPECGSRFMVPDDAVGTQLDCIDCPWTGTCVQVDEIPLVDLLWDDTFPERAPKAA